MRKSGTNYGITKMQQPIYQDFAKHALPLRKNNAKGRLSHRRDYA